MTQGAGIPRSVQALASLALQVTAADGYSIYEIDAGTGDRRLKVTAGLTEGSKFRFPLGRAERSGEVVFVCGSGTSGERAKLERIAHAIGQVWRLSFLPESYAQEAARIGALQAELADSKIAERAQGLLAGSPPDGEAVATILHHVESVLRPSEIESALAQFALDLEQQIAERELASRAKAVLQTRFGLSEEQAHAHLRVVSRTSRKRLRDVAQAVIANPESGAKGLSV